VEHEIKKTFLWKNFMQNVNVGVGFFEKRSLTNVLKNVMLHVSYFLFLTQISVHGKRLVETIEF
jgi:hypothetical protein